MVVGTGLAVTSRRSAFSADTDTYAGAVNIDFTGKVAGTLTVLAGLSSGTSDECTGVVTASRGATGSSASAGAIAALASVVGALTVDAALAATTLLLGTGIVFTNSIHTDFAGVAEHSCASFDTVSAAAEFTVGALFAGTWVVEAFAVDTGLSARTLGGVGTFGIDALAVDADVGSRAVAVAGTGIRTNTLTVFADLFGVGTGDAETWVILAGVLSTADTSMLAHTGARVTAVFFAATVDADLTSGAGFFRTGVVDALSVYTFGVAST